MPVGRPQPHRRGWGRIMKPKSIFMIIENGTVVFCSDDHTQLTLEAFKGREDEMDV